MRKTKFRAWDTYNEAWADEYLAIAEDGYVIEIKNDGTTEYWKDRFIIEFGTGLKDKNGKEIYEGDIVLVANQGRTPYVVIYREGDCSFVCNNEFIVDYVYLFNGMPQCYEVIGNIHENPELLDVKEEG